MIGIWVRQPLLLGGIGTDSGAGIGNIIPQNNILIISEDGDQSDPDDNAKGGTLRFSFGEEYGVLIDAIGLLDIDVIEKKVKVKSYQDNQLVNSYNAQSLGDNSYQKLILEGEQIDQLDVNLVQSGAVTELEYRRIYGNTATIFVNSGNDILTSSDMSFYTSPVNDAHTNV